MTQVTDHINISTLLQTSSSPRPSFKDTLFLVDDTQVPLDMRVVEVTKTSYANRFSSAGDPYKFAQKYFSQALTPSNLKIGKWQSTNSHPTYVMPSWNTTLSAWTPVVDGEFKVTDGTNTDSVTACSFAACTSISQIATVLTAKIQAIGAPTVAGLNTSNFVIDDENRITLVMSTSGAAADDVWIIAGAAGTDISADGFLKVSTGFVVSGIDAEEPEDALAAISLIDDAYYCVTTERSLTTDQQEAVANYIESLNKIYVAVENDTTAKSAATTTDLGYVLSDAGIQRTLVIYSEHAAEWPDACEVGRCITYTEGSATWGFKNLSGVSQSGLALSGASRPLYDSEVSVLKDKGYNWISKLGTTIYMEGRDKSGLTTDGTEIRLIIGKDWFVANLAADYMDIMFGMALPAFNNETLNALRSALISRLNECIENDIGVSYTIDFPTEDDFTSADRATHQMTLEDVFVLNLNSTVNEITLTGTWTY